MDLSNKTILVVGGATGIGRAAASVCTGRGARVIVADVNESAGEQTAAAINAPFIRVNVADEDSVRRMFDHIAERYDRLDVLIQTAGVLKGAFVPVAEFPLETWRSVMDINVTGSFLCAKHAVPIIKKAGRGVIILVSSMAATGVSSSVAYGSSKGSVSSLGVTLAAKLAADNIRVNVVHPGGIKTDMKLSVIGREAELHGQSGEQAIAQAAAGTGLGEPEGMGKILAWLASDDADYVRGFLTTR
jgi:NAD(P)-dependent dehydrogenase (short-subunit alcohol dehydrogenase family)